MLHARSDYNARVVDLAGLIPRRGDSDLLSAHDLGFEALLSVLVVAGEGTVLGAVDVLFPRLNLPVRILGGELPVGHAVLVVAAHFAPVVEPAESNGKCRLK